MFCFLKSLLFVVEGSFHCWTMQSLRGLRPFECLRMRKRAVMEKPVWYYCLYKHNIYSLPVLSICLCLSLFLFNAHTHTRARARTHKLWKTHTHTHTHTQLWRTGFVSQRTFLDQNSTVLLIYSINMSHFCVRLSSVVNDKKGYGMSWSLTKSTPKYCPLTCANEALSFTKIEKSSDMLQAILIFIQLFVSQVQGAGNSVRDALISDKRYDLNEVIFVGC